jgi:hypothetical protein
MGVSTTVALALLMLTGQAARAQAALPSGFVDAAAVVEGLAAEIAILRQQQFRR